MSLFKPLSDAEQCWLILLLSDLESGHARQWYWLEIAQTLSPATRTPRVHALGIVIRSIGINTCSNILIRLKIKGAHLYQRAANCQAEFFQQKLNDALLFSGSLMALLAGVQRLAASQQFAAWCLGLGGAAWQIWQVIRKNSARNTAETLEVENALPGSEASLGLPSILLAAGIKPEVSLTLVKGLKNDCDAFLQPLLHNLPALAPSTEFSPLQKACVAAAPWLLLAYINSWIIGRLPHYWGVVGAFAWMTGMAIVSAKTPKAWHLLLASWLGCFGLASLSHSI